MSCKHELRAITDFGEPQTKEEPAWCRLCGALWTLSPWGGWGFCHPITNEDAPTALNIIRKQMKEDKAK